MAPEILIAGAGMIVRDQILPALYQLQRLGRVGEIGVCASKTASVDALARDETLLHAFPGQSFRRESSYREALGRLAPRNLVAVAVPEHLHHGFIMEALGREQHVLSVKPLALEYRHAEEIAGEARRRGLLVGIDYHKRFDDRSLMARRAYREGRFGEFRLGAARLIEKWHYRHSNFQNWMTAGNSDAFTYIGCHYVDLVRFITGLQPAAVSVYGILDRFPNGRQGYLWTDARILWENGACLNVQNGLGLPDAAPGANTQGLTLYFQGGDAGAWLDHSDQYRGLRYCYTSPPAGPGATLYAEPNPDYLQYVDLGGPGLIPVGYGYRSIAHIVEAAAAVNAGRPPESIDAAGLMATPANSACNERVIEAARASLSAGGREINLL
jgi:predicted dehydrogenase